MPFYERSQHHVEHHVSYVFPSSTADICTLTAAAADTYSDYTRIVDAPGGNFLDALFTTDGHMTAMLAEMASVANEEFMVEISYGASHELVTHFRLQSETNKLPTDQIPKVRASHIEAGEQLFYRCMCSVGGPESIEVHFRYFLT